MSASPTQNVTRHIDRVGVFRVSAFESKRAGSFEVGCQPSAHIVERRFRQGNDAGTFAEAPADTVSIVTAQVHSFPSSLAATRMQQKVGNVVHVERNQIAGRHPH